MSRRREILRVLEEDQWGYYLMYYLMMQVIFAVEKDEVGGNMKGNGINCWKYYAIKASFMQTKQNTELRNKH